MEAKAGRCHVFDALRSVEARQNSLDLVDKGGLHPASIAALEQALQSAMLEARDHRASLCMVTIVACQRVPCPKQKAGPVKARQFCRISNASGNLPEGTADTITPSQGGIDERITASTVQV
jgi:hypothetical protein